MRCHICNNALGETEVKFNKKHQEFDPCGTCLEVIESVFEDYVEPEEEVEDDSEQDPDLEGI